MKTKQEVAFIEKSSIVDNYQRVNNDIYWLTVVSITKKVVARYGPFHSAEDARVWAKEHHISLF